MATPGKPIDNYDRREIVRLRRIGKSIREIASTMRVSTRTVQKYAKQELQSTTLVTQNCN